MKTMYTWAATVAIMVALAGCGDGQNDMDDNDTTDVGATLDTAASRTGEAVQSAGQEVSDETVEKAVEAALVVKPGFGGVTVESEADGVIILNGTVATEAEKTEAQTTAEGTAGVKSVKNNLTVQP